MGWNVPGLLENAVGKAWPNFMAGWTERGLEHNSAAPLSSQENSWGFDQLEPFVVQHD